ncbi:MAG TPA: hypothetical protein VGK10_08790 [Prolixibacteraceae bacterium]|jgi:hypothetical protein
MKKIIFLFIGLFTITMAGLAQRKSNYGFYTDRDVYVSGETLMAKIYLPDGTPSSILSLDLVNQQGTRITGASLSIQNNEAEGYLQLPDSLSSGIYLVRTYQKYNAAKLKTIREIWISNRFDAMGTTIQMKRVVGFSPVQDQRTNQIKISKVEPKYNTNSQIEAQVSLDESLLKELDGNLLVSVAQIDPSFSSVCFSMQDESAKKGIIENKGVIISGTVTDKKTTEPVNDMTVYLTIPDSIPGFQYYKTQKDGRFYFLLDKYYGSIQVVIQCFANVPSQRLNIHLDDFFAESGILPEFTIAPVTEEFKNNITRNISAATFRKVFGQDALKTLIPPKKRLESYPYYGKATQTVDPHRFIDLPDFTEISRELLPGVKFRNYNNEPSLQVINSTTHSYFEGKPLILMDGIPIQDLNVIKDMGTEDIDRIDICQSERFYGDLRFPGVVAIYTTKADYSRLPESSQLIRLKVETIQLPSALAEPTEREATVPDLRQLLYWNPSTVPTQNLLVKCNASTIEGPFKLLVRGRLKDGTLIYSEQNFEVK